MDQFILDISKYVIAFFVLLYAYESFAVFFKRTLIQKKGIYTRQNIMMYLIHFLCFMSIFLYTKDTTYLLFYGFQVIAIIGIKLIYKYVYPKTNELILNNMCMLLMISFIMLSRLNFDKAKKQYFIVLVGLVLALLIPILIKELKLLKRLTWVYAGVGLFALGSVYLFGAVTNGSKINFNIAGISFQPAELVKIIFVFFLASILVNVIQFKNILISAGLAVFYILILVLSRDLGSALIFSVVYLALLFVATEKYYFLLGGLLAGAFSSVIAYQLFSHVRVRVQSFLDPWSTIDSGGYQITQSLFAIGSGGWFGSGIFQGTPESIPYVETDFIFSSISEELGLVVAICVILIYISTFLMFMNISMKLKDKFYRYLACGLGIMFIFQIFLTVGGGTKFIPLTGVTLPLISYGGTSVIVTIILFSIFQGLHLIEKEQVETSEEKEHSEKEHSEKEVEEQVDLSLEKESSVTKKKTKFFKKDNIHTLILIYFFMVLYGALILSMIYFLEIQSPKILDNSYNTRQVLLEKNNIRGNIYSADGKLLATTNVDENGTKTRSYPYNEVFSHVVGFSTKGRSGIEATENYYLVRSSISVFDKLKNDLTGDKDPGDNIYTTLDTKLQQAAYDALGTNSGAVVVMNPETGEIYAMVSKPDFDPNKIDEIWDELVGTTTNQTPGEDSENSTTEETDAVTASTGDTTGMLLNRATQGAYPPGSIFKIVTALEYLKENNNVIYDYSFDCNGKFEYQGSVIKCYHNTKHGVVNFTESFAKSCNSSFANLGLTLDMDLFSKTFLDCMFNETLPLDMVYRKSTCVISSESTTDDILQSVIGQGETIVTPIHMAMITSAIANEGMVMKPYLIDYIQTANDTVIKQYTRTEYRQIMSLEESTMLKALMLAVVEDGTATKLSGLEYTAAGKTGSAEYGEDGESHAWFTGFAPYDDPEIVITVIVEGGGSGGETAVPIAKEIFDAYFNLAP